MHLLWGKKLPLRDSELLEPTKDAACNPPLLHPQLICLGFLR